MSVDNIKNLEECKKYVQQRLEELRPLFAKVAIGDFSNDVPMPEEDDEFTELYTGIQTMIEVVRTKIADLESEVGQRQEVEQRLIARNKELAESQKAMLNILEDLQETKAAVEQEAAKYEALLTSIGDGVMAVDTNGVLIFINSSAADMLKISEQDVVGKKLVEIIRMEDASGISVPSVSRVINMTIKTGVSNSSSNYYYIRKDNNKFPVSLTVNPIIFGKKVIGAIEVFKDITREKELDKARSEFISIASHQLRTPVSALNWIAESFRASLKGLDDKQKEYFDDFSISVNRLVRVVEDLLNVSRIEMGTLKIDAEEVILSDFLKDFLKSIKPFADLNKHKVVLKELSKDRLALMIDPKVLNDIIQNLASNAIEYSPADTVVTITLEKEGNYVKISVANRGPAITEEERAHLFQKFYRGESGKKMKQDGTGLGLYIVRSLVENSGGKIDFVSGKGKETVFWFTLPLKK